MGCGRGAGASSVKRNERKLECLIDTHKLIFWAYFRGRWVPLFRSGAFHPSIGWRGPSREADLSAAAEAEVAVRQPA